MMLFLALMVAPASPTTASVPTVTLRNAANPGVAMPVTGLGTGCAIGGCNIGPGSDMVAFNM